MKSDIGVEKFNKRKKKINYFKPSFLFCLLFFSFSFLLFFLSFSFSFFSLQMLERDSMKGEGRKQRKRKTFNGKEQKFVSLSSCSLSSLFFSSLSSLFFSPFLRLMSSAHRSADGALEGSTSISGTSLVLSFSGLLFCSCHCSSHSLPHCCSLHSRSPEFWEN